MPRPRPGRRPRQAARSRGGARGRRPGRGRGMTRFAYALAWVLAAPLALVRLAWRARRQPGYLAHVAERFGFYRGTASTQPLIWIHAVSVGETRAAAPLVAAFAVRHPRQRILLTH